MNLSSHIVGLIVGGIVPAFLFGLSAVLAKASNSSGIGLGYYMLAVGSAVLIAGGICLAMVPDRTLSVVSARDAFLSGATWALGAALVAVALSRFGSPISQLVPLYNMNTLVAVVIGLWLFSEWQDVSLIKLFIGSLFIVIGGTLVAWA